jgi:hypothetical protein
MTIIQPNPVISTSTYANLVYSVGYPVVPITRPLLTIILHSSVRTIFIHNDKIFSLFHEVTTEFEYNTWSQTFSDLKMSSKQPSSKDCCL